MYERMEYIMKKEDQELLRVFYQSLANQGFSTSQLQLYAALRGSKQQRLDWVKTYGETLNLPPNITALLSSIDEFTKEDLAVIAAGQVASVIAPKVQGLITKILSWLKFW
jgi:hypothetical protein